MAASLIVGARHDATSTRLPGNWLGTILAGGMMAAEREGIEAAPLSEGAYRALVDAALDIVAVFDRDGRIRFINDAVTRVLGHRPVDLVGRTVHDFIHPEDLQRAASRFAELGADKDTGGRTAVYRLRHLDGSYRNLESLSTNRLGDPAVGGICLVARDVTGRLAEESDRLAAQERRQLMARVARIGIWEWNTETDELIADEAVHEIGRQRPDQRWNGAEEFLQRFLEVDRGPLEKAMRNAANGQASVGRVARMPLPDGGLRWLYFHARPVQSEDPPGPWVLGLIMDITERKRAEEEITRRGELLELASWGADLGVWTWFPAEDRAVIDERSALLIGLPPDRLELTTAECNRPVHPEDLKELNRLEEELLAGTRDVFDFAYRTRRDEAGWHWVVDRGRVSERDADGRPVRVSGVTLDLDEAKRRERQIEDQRLRLDLALSAARLGIWDFDVQADELFVDRRYTDIVGLPPEAVRLEYPEFNRRVHEEDRPRLMAAARDCLAGRTGSIRFEGRLLKPDGRLTWIRLEGIVAMHQPDGMPARIIGTIADVTERRRVEQLTRVGELVGGLGSYEFDAAADRFYWSDGTYRMFGLSPSFVPTRQATRDLVLPSSMPLLAEAFRAAVEEGREFDIELWARTATHEKIWVRMLGRVESFQGRPVRIYGIVQDITERKSLEAALLEAANREQQKLGRELHDGLGQELTGISLLLQGLAQQVKAASPQLARPLDRVTTLLSTAIRSTRALAHGLAPVGIGDGGLENALQVLAEQATANYAIPVTFSVGQEGSPELDELAGNHLYRIAQEALSNAVRHGRARTVSIRLASTAEGASLEVLDDGCGIGKEASLRQGLGLRSMAYRAQSIGAALSIRQRDGGGTRLQVRCPRATA
jgi:PAS domain S-box-containing protein